MNFTNAEVSGSLSAEDLASLPVEARDLATVLYRLPNVMQSTGFFNEAPSVSINGANGLPMFNDGKLELSVDVFNVFNEVNLSGYAVNATASNQFQAAGRPFQTRSSDRPRTFQFGARHLF